ncbi:MAG: hypothetical protein CMJ48_13295 [Planctomycetaceae bacterium]|nr:hypothetical protein [Planctomycetaceae bacterium]
MVINNTSEAINNKTQQNSENKSKDYGEPSGQEGFTGVGYPDHHRSENNPHGSTKQTAQNKRRERTELEPPRTQRACDILLR